MNIASIAELKARLSEFIAAVRRGDEVIVTDRGRPVARLTGLGDERKLDARMAELTRAGVVRPPRRKLDASLRHAARPPDPDARLLEALLAEREEGR